MLGSKSSYSPGVLNDLVWRPTYRHINAVALKCDTKQEFTLVKQHQSNLPQRR